MAIINCPECNEKISDSVRQCIHCGAKISVCKECGSVFQKELDYCPNCGFVISSEFVVNSKEKNTKEKFSEQIVERWEKETPLSFLYTKSITIQVIFIVLALTFTVLAIQTFFSWLSIFKNESSSIWGELENQANAMITAEETLSKIKGYFSFCALFCCIEAMFTLKNLISAFGFANWAKNNSLNLSEILNNDFSLDFYSMSFEKAQNCARKVQLSLNAHLYNTSLHIKNSSIKFLFIKSFSYIFSNAFIMYITYKLAEFIMSNVLNGTMKTNFIEMIGDFVTENALLILLLIVVYIGLNIYTSSQKKQIENIRKNWVEKNLTEGQIKYEKYIKDPEGFRFAQEFNKRRYY